MIGTLTLTFRGPFLFRVPGPTLPGVPCAYVEIYAPRCNGHLGSVFFGHQSYSLNGTFRNGGQQIYALASHGLVPNTGDISYQWDNVNFDNPILSPEMQAPPVAYASNLPDAYFCIQVPRPKVFFALDVVGDTEVVSGLTPAHKFQNYLTAFRLYYDWDLNAPDPTILLKFPVNAGGQYKGLTPPVGVPTSVPSGHVWQSLGTTGDVEFRFEGPGMSDPDHQDASDCFDQMAKLAGLPWWLNFDNVASANGAQFRSGLDCKAIPIALGVGN